ncbi:hypothetical protein I3843_03G115500 [Carya illinoinensis]|uniref:Uncharacterized protein n=1 Tax=Carya illinoinensis TaxID=32201 RepID=A0A922FJT1_CARIL|nr:hypothetical protein I3842_03G116500 [Carya illinoinensis]KAG7987104.1 hypothetical protein I3843_03G115500 [Carya illinoinensis]
MEDSHLVETRRVVEGLVSRMDERSVIELRLQSQPNRGEACIFRSDRVTNGLWPCPRIVSIGPLNDCLIKTEEQKWRYLTSSLSDNKYIALEDIVTSIRPLETKARKCYESSDWEHNMESVDFLQGLVLDGCFIIELFLRVNSLKQFEADDPLSRMLWTSPDLYGDLLLLHNQIPFFVLEKLYDTSVYSKYREPLPFLAMRFFNNVMRRPQEVVDGYRNYKESCLHLLDLVRLSYLPREQEQQRKKGSGRDLRIIPCVSKLLRSGIKVNLVKESSFLSVRFKRGVIEMPGISIDDFMVSFLINCIVFEEERNNTTKHFMSYAHFLNCLVNSDKDVEYLSERRVIDNYVGSDGDLEKHVSHLGRSLLFGFDQFYLSNLFIGVEEYYRNDWNWQWASFKGTYFKTPWTFISAMAGLVLLVLTFLQTFYTIYAYVHSNVVNGPPLPTG